MPSAETTAIVRPAYRQFYLQRGDAAWRSDEISDEGYARGLEAVDGFVYVGTTMYGSPTKILVRVHPSRPSADSSADRVAETTIGGAGDLAVFNWEPGEDPVAVVALPSGSVAARVSWFGTEAALAHHDSDLGGDDLSPEHLLLDLWPSG